MMSFLNCLHNNKKTHLQHDLVMLIGLQEMKSIYQGQGNHYKHISSPKWDDIVNHIK